MLGLIFSPDKSARTAKSTESPAAILRRQTPSSSFVKPSSSNATRRGQGSGESANLRVKKLGKEAVSGVETRHVRIFDDDNDAVIDLWLTNKYPADLWTRAFRGRNIGLEMSDDERTKAMKKYGIEPGFSMKMRVAQQGGVPVVFLVERIERGPVPASVFALPEGYTRQRAPQQPRP